LGATVEMAAAGSFTKRPRTPSGDTGGGRWSERRRTAAVQAVLSAPPGSQHYEIALEPAPKSTPWRNSVGRTYRRLTRDSSWWVTVRRADLNWPVRKERFGDHDAAAERADEIASLLVSGDLSFTRPVLRRRSVRDPGVG
jgi:hypothetical protein